MKHKAPAVHQTIVIIKLLQRLGALNLTELAEKSGFPKSTILRLLDTLHTHGWIGREDENKSYRLLVHIASDDDPAKRRVQIIQSAVNNLSTQTGCTVEWYRICADYSEITQRCEPADQPVKIRAQLGYKRNFASELEAVNRIVFACGAADCQSFEPTQGYSSYENGEKVQIPISRAIKMIKSVGSDHLTHDVEWNGRGFRRHAAGIIGNAGALFGILSVAVPFTPKADDKIELINSLLLATKEDLQASLF